MISLDKRRVETSGGVMAFVDAGEGEPVLLLHGFPLSSHLWRSFVPLLAQGTRVLAPDLIGCGDSGGRADAALDLRSQAGYVRELLAELGIESAAVVAHGSGGAIAQTLALDGADVRAMVLIDSLAFDLWPTEDMRALLAIAEEERTPDLLRGIIARTLDLGMQRGRLTDEDVREYQRPFADEDGVRAYFRATAQADSGFLEHADAGLGELDVPVLLLWGEEDASFPPTVAERLQDAMPMASLALLPGCSHLLPEEAPGTIGPLLWEWLRARYLKLGHDHAASAGPVVVSLGRRPPIEQELLEEEFDDEFADSLADSFDDEEGSA
jgi:pimeloyl-ACP methyl ester carboxylesterase